MFRRHKVLSIVLLLIVVTVGSLALVVSHDSPCGAREPMPANTQSMQAIVYRCYGPPEVVKLEQIAKPIPADNRVLVRVRAASVNPLDWHYMRGKPYVMRPMAGVGAPNDIRLGVHSQVRSKRLGRASRVSGRATKCLVGLTAHSRSM